MTVLETILNFKQALIAVVPAFEKAGLSWRRPDAYDEWDAVASALFTSLVVEVLRWQLPERLRDGFRLARYDLLLDSYRDVSTIEVVNFQATSDDRLVFHALGSEREAFDSVEVRSVSAEGEARSDTLELLPLRDVSLRLRAVDPSAPDVLMLE